jgi:hypothetical protein
VDGTNLGALVDGFKSILDDAETLTQLDITLLDGSILENVAVGADGAFAIDGLIRQGNNLFRAKATTNLGNIGFADLNVIGGVIPEPAMAALLFCAGAMMALPLRLNRGKRRFKGRRSE